MNYLMIMWSENDAAGGTQADIDAWTSFESEARKAKVLVLGKALQPPTASRLARPELANPTKGEEVSGGTFSKTKAQIGGFYVFNCKDDDQALMWARKLPTYGTVEVRPCIDYDLS